jgi:hypothetical protein
MVTAGELEGNIESEEGEEEEGEEEEGEEEESEEEVKIDEMKTEMKEKKEPVNEIIGSIAATMAIVGALLGGGWLKASSDEKKEIKAKAEELVKAGKSDDEAAKLAIAAVKKAGEKAYGTGTKAQGTAGSAFAESEMEEMKSELEEAYSTIKTIKTELQEVNLFNAKLLYTNKIFKAKNLTESQKVKVLAAFDKAASVKEAKLVFETLSEGFKEKKSPVNESMLRGSASRVAGVAEKKPILEVNNQFARWQQLAGIKK